MSAVATNATVLQRWISLRDDLAVEQNGVGIDLINACGNRRKTSHDASIKIDDQSHFAPAEAHSLVGLPLGSFGRLDSYFCSLDQIRMAPDGFDDFIYGDNDSDPSIDPACSLALIFNHGIFI
jgi:hypothetical protein